MASAVGDFVRVQLGRLERPDLVGVSVLFSGQVLWGLVVSEVARELWGATPVVWGGTHVTALKPWIEREHSYAEGATFVFEGNIASFFPRSKKHASLMFHQGAKIPGDHPVRRIRPMDGPQ